MKTAKERFSCVLICRGKEVTYSYFQSRDYAEKYLLDFRRVMTEIGGVTSFEIKNLIEESVK